MSSVQQQLAELAGWPDAVIDLPRGALLISALIQPGLDTGLHRRRLESLCIAAETCVDASAPIVARIAGLNRFLFDREGFHGNRDDYHDPRNSLLDQVLERRTGIPITLSVVYQELANRLGLHARGVGFPGHFLVSVGEGRERILVDPFDEGRVLVESDLDGLLDQVYGEGVLRVGANPRLLRAATRRETLVRMLANLKGIYARNKDLEHVLTVSDALLRLQPDSEDALRERGLIYRELGHLPAALADLSRYVEVASDAQEIARIAPLLAELRSASMRVH